jgi:hypothetical protein
MVSLSPSRAALRTLQYALAGRLHFPRHRVGKTITMDGQEWVVFREVFLDPAAGRPEVPGAIFWARFHVVGMSARQNILFSLIPIPFFVGLPGLRTKLWMYSPETGDFCGVYEWDTVQDAENYSRCFAARFMARRSVPGSVSFRITSACR